MEEHVEIINACGDLRHAIADVGDVRAAGRRLGGLLGHHTATEEVGLFSVMKRRDEFADHVSTLCGEHRTLDELLDAIVDGDHSLMETFEKALRDHIHKEDNGLFPAAAMGLDGDEWVEIDEVTHEHDHATGTAHAHHH